MAVVVGISRPLFLFIEQQGHIAPFNKIPIQANAFYNFFLSQEVIRLIVTERINIFGKTIIEVVAPERIKKRDFEDYKDYSIEIRRHLAAKIAYTQFEQRKDRALIDVHRAGFMR